MNFKKAIDYKIKTLIDIMITAGVSPSDLANNVFDKEYISISFKKKNDKVIGNLKFYERTKSLQIIEMYYTYNEEKKLIRIEENVNGIVNLLWDRNKREEDLIKETLYLMKSCYTAKQIVKFIYTLPDEIKDRMIVLNASIA